MGGLLTIGYCFTCCFLETFVGDKGLMEGGGKVVIEEILLVPPH